MAVRCTKLILVILTIPRLADSSDVAVLAIWALQKCSVDSQPCRDEDWTSMKVTEQARTNLDEVRSNGTVLLASNSRLVLQQDALNVVDAGRNIRPHFSSRSDVSMYDGPLPDRRCSGSLLAVQFHDCGA